MRSRTARISYLLPKMWNDHNLGLVHVIDVFVFTSRGTSLAHHSTIKICLYNWCFNVSTAGGHWARKTARTLGRKYRSARRLDCACPPRWHRPNAGHTDKPGAFQYAQRYADANEGGKHNQ